jgi:uncharacterized repeat protein (TIGR03803 family)
MKPCVLRFGLGLAVAVQGMTVTSGRATAGNLTAIASFNGSNGSDPTGTVAIDSKDNIYGTAQAGGANGQGTVWEIANGTTNITALTTFDLSNGSGNVPSSGVTIDSAGNLYGTTAYGPLVPFTAEGTVWQIASGTSNLTTLASFTVYGSSGFRPYAGVTIDGSGNLYGTAVFGGANGYGTVWEIAKGTTNLTILGAFNGSNGGGPSAGVTVSAAGNLYGTTGYNGANGDGTVWEIAKGTTNLTALASFNGSIGTSGGVTIDSAGNLFGTSAGGGANGYGTVWEIAKGTTTLTVLASFNGVNGSFPDGNITIDGAGNLYGTAQTGGANGQGTVWEIANGTTDITALASFTYSNGAGPTGGVTIDAAGNLYGVAQYGGANGDGTVWMYSSAPEPSSLVLTLFGLGLAGGACALRRLRSSS